MRTLTARGIQPDFRKGHTSGARILSVADAFSTMTTGKAYRDPFPFDSAQSELVWCSGTQFDPEVVKAMVNLLNRI